MAKCRRIPYIRQLTLGAYIVQELKVEIDRKGFGPKPKEIFGKRVSLSQNIGPKLAFRQPRQYLSGAIFDLYSSYINMTKTDKISLSLLIISTIISFTELLDGIKF